MEKEVKFGSRIILINYRGKYNKEIADFFVRIIKKIEMQMGRVMDECEIPREINLNFKRGKGELDGFYHVQKKNVAKYLIVIDVFTDGIKFVKEKRRMLYLEKNLIDTFVHEIVHNKYAKEGETRERTKKIAWKLISQFIR